MKWYQAHFRIMMRMFELGLFDEVNACYRKYCLEGTTSAYDQLMSLVISDDVKRYCKSFAYKKLGNNKHSVSTIMTNYYKASAGFAMVKAIQIFADSNFKEIYIVRDVPQKYYQVLFEPNGELKDDVLMKAVNTQTYTCAPGVIASSAITCDINEYNNSNLEKLSSLYPNAPFGFEFSLNNERKMISVRDVEALRKAESKQKSTRYLANQAAPAKEVNYFHIDSKLDAGYGILRVFDLLGMHLLLVAQRRQYLFSLYGKDDLRSNYKALEQVNSHDIVRLHNNAVKACGVLEEAQNELFSQKVADYDFIALAKAYVGRNNALYKYICYFCGLFADLEPNTSCTNEAYSWAVSYYYYNLKEPFKQFSQLQTKLLNHVNDLLDSRVNQFKGRTELFSFDQEIMNNLIDLLQSSMYNVCALYAPYFKNEQLSHPRVVNFQDIVNSCLSYSKGINKALPVLPYPIKFDSPYNDDDDDGVPSRLKANEKDLNHIHEIQAFAVINDPKPIVFSRKLNVYLDMFCFMSIMVELYNDLYFKTIFVSAKEYTTGINSSFDLAHLGIDWEKAVYPTYEKLLKSEDFSKLIEAHKACFDKLVLIMDLQGDSNLLYEDGYMANLLRKTNNYDQELADSLATGHASSNRPSLSKAEQILLNKTCIGYLQECYKLCQISKDLANKHSEFDNFLNEQTGNFIDTKTQLLSNIYKLYLMPIRALTQCVLLSLDNVPKELRESIGLSSDNELTNKISNLRSLFNSSPDETIQDFYKCVYETLLVLLAKDVNSHLKVVIPYSNLDNKQDFAQSLPSLTLLTDEACEFKNTDYIVMVAAKRFLQGNAYDPAIQKQICKNTLFVNSALGLVLAPLSISVQLMMIGLIKDFVYQVLALTKQKQVDEYKEYLNTVYNIVHNLAKFWSTNLAKLKNLNSLLEQNNLMLSEHFEYKAYISEIIDMLSMTQNLFSQYMKNNRGLRSFNKAFNTAKWISLYQDLLENAPKALQYIDVRFFKNLCSKDGTIVPYFDEQEYISLNDKYLENVMDVAGARLTQPQLTVVKLFFGDEVASLVEREDDQYFDDDYFSFSSFYRGVSREKGLTKTNMRLIDLVMEKMHLLDDVQLHQLLNLESQKIAAQIFDSSTATSNGKLKAQVSSQSRDATTKSKAPKANALESSKAQSDAGAEADANARIEAGTKAKAKSATRATAAKSRAKILAAIASTEVKADKAIEDNEDTLTKPKKNAARAKKAATKISASAKSNLEVEVETNADGAAKTKTKAKAKTTTKATATKSRSKKVAATASTEFEFDDWLN